MDANYIFQVIASLLVAIALLILVVFVLKKMNFQSIKSNSQISILSTKNIGPRERLVLIEIAGKQLLIGATPQAINALHLVEGSTQSGQKSRTKDGLEGQIQSDGEPRVDSGSAASSENSSFVDPKFMQILRGISGANGSGNNGLGG